MSAVLNITMDQGSSLEYTFNLKADATTAFDLTGFDARLQVRKSYAASSAEINCTLANGKLVFSNAAGGVLKLVLAPTDTSGIKFLNVGDSTLACVYDLELVSPLGKVSKPVRGSFTLIREVTR